MSAQTPITRFSLDLWMSFFCRFIGAPIMMLKAYSVARMMCSCKNFSLDLQGDHVLTCKKHTGATRGHNCVMDVLAQLACNTGYARIFLLICKATTCLLAKSTQEPPEATIVSWMSWRKWPATQATLCASRCRQRWPPATSRVMSNF